MLREGICGLLKVTPRNLRKFGLSVGGVFCLLGLFFLWLYKWWYLWLLWPGVSLIVLGTILPRSLKRIYFAWMTLAMVMGAVVSTILLVILFYFVVTPIGLFARVVGKDFLNLKLD